MAQTDNSSHASSEETFDVSDSGSDFEVELKSRNGRKRNIIPKHAPVPPKRPRRKAASLPSSGSSLSPTPPASSPHRQPPSHGTPRVVSPKPASPRRERRGDKDRQFINAEDMYEAIRSGKSAVVTVVDEWLDGYKHDRNAGLLVLINFVVQCCGCKGVVSREMFDNMQNAEIISTLTKEFNEESVSYPLSSSGSQWKRFKAGLCDFFRVLVRCCQNSLLYDDFLFSSLLALLTGLSDSQVRAFRHTSTLIAMKLMSALVDVAVQVFAQVKTTQRRHDVETSRRPEDRALGRMEELQASIRQLLEQQEELSSMMNAVFRGVFVHRYRDLVPEVRAACITEMGVWLKENPAVFLNDGYLKYIGWTLHDKQGLVRLQCVRALQGLYQEKDFIGRLELFTSRFKERMLSMVLDKEPDVAVEAVQLLLLIQKMTEEGLSEEECGSVYPLVYASHRGLASAAGAFLYHKLCSVLARDTEHQEMGARRTELFNILVSFYIQSEFHEHGAYLVDSLWAVAGSELRDWETMTTLLLQETEPGQGPTDEEEGALIELMMCSMRQAAEVHPPVGRAQGKKVLSMKDKKIQAQDRRRFTAHFIPVLPQLLAKYSADVEKVTSLLKAPLYCDLEAYSSTSRLEKCLDRLLVQVWAVVEKHTDGGVLEGCARVACALSSPRYTFSSRVELAVSQLMDRLTDRFSSHLNDLLQGTADEEEVYSAANTLKRIAAFSSAKDLTGWKLFEPCFKLLKSGTQSGDLDKELMVPALKCAAFHLLWERQKVSGSTPSEVELKQLRKEFRSFCVVCQSCLSAGQAEIRDQSFELLCDLLLVFSLGSVRSQPALRSLALPPCDSLRSEMAAFLLDYVFTEPDDPELAGEEEEEAEGRIATLQRRRNQLAGYCKLVIYGVLDLSAATDIFRHYNKFYKDYGDIIKETLSKTRMMIPVQSARMLCLSLQQLFTVQVLEEPGAGDLGEIRDLARRMAMSFGIDLQRVREPLLALHTDGIRFAFREAEDDDEGPPPNLPFLEILSEFSFKLLRQDRAKLLVDLKGQCGSAAPSWPALKMYQRSLQPSSSRTAEAPSPHITPMAKRRRPSPPDSLSSVNEEAWLDISVVRGTLPAPTLTSTLEKQPSTHAGYAASVESESESDNFSEGSLMNRVEPQKHTRPPGTRPPGTRPPGTRPPGTRPPGTQPPGTRPSPSELDSHLTLLTLIEEEEQDADIDEFESDYSDSETAVTLPSTRRSTSYLEDLF